MSRQSIHTDQAPAAIGPYVQAVECGNMVFCSGQLPMDPETGELVADDVSAAAGQAIRNLAAVLDAAGCNLGDVVKTTVFLKNLADFDAVNKVYAEYFGDAPPARACVEVARLPKDAPLEIEAVAMKG